MGLPNEKPDKWDNVGNEDEQFDSSLLLLSSRLPYLLHVKYTMFAKLVPVPKVVKATTTQPIG